MKMGLDQKSFLRLIGVSPSRLSDYISGKCEPILKVARETGRKLNGGSHSWIYEEKPKDTSKRNSESTRNKERIF